MPTAKDQSRFDRFTNLNADNDYPLGLGKYSSYFKKYGFAFTNKFEMYITNPPILNSKYLEDAGFSAGNTSPITNLVVGTSNSLEAEKVFNLSCMSVSPPRSSYDTIENSINGTWRKVAGARDFDNFTCKFYIDSRYLLYRYFLTWQNLIFDPITKVRTYPDQHQSPQATLVMYNNAGESFDHTELKFINIYPSEVSIPKLAWSEENQLMVLEVTFAYEMFYTKYDSDLSRKRNSDKNNGQVIV